ncbi:MAG TPA: porin family protein [Gemmatimonadaceae bacterium]|nr:porin family protein [Gemmatimonadaceae bacterium]
MSRITRAAITAIGLSIGVIPSFARAQFTREMTFGVMAGLQYSKVAEDPDATEVEYKYKPGLLAGVFLGIPLTDMVSIEPQLLFSQKGTNVEGVGATSNLEGSIRGNYIEVPVLFKLSFPGYNSQVTPFVFAGPYGAYRLNCKAEGVILAVTGDRDCDETEVIDIKSTDFGGTIGGGVRFRMGSQLVILDARYSHGFTNINDDVDSDVRDIKNRAFAVTLGLGWAVHR